MREFWNARNLPKRNTTGGLWSPDPGSTLPSSTRTMLLPVQKRFLFPKGQRAIHPSQCPWVSVKLPSSHILTNPQILNSHSQLTFDAKWQMLQAEGWEGELISAQPSDRLCGQKRHTFCTDVGVRQSLLSLTLLQCEEGNKGMLTKCASLPQSCQGLGLSEISVFSTVEFSLTSP